MRDDILSKHLGKILFTFVVIAISIGLIAIFLYRSTFSGPIIAEHTAWGVFGDFIGGLLNPIFALFAFFALLITIHIQSKELAFSTEQLEKSAKALADQNKALQLQNFESTFFQMVRLHNDIVKNMYFRDLGIGPNELRGRDCFKEYYRMFRINYDHALSHAKVQDPLVIIEDAYEAFFLERQADVGHYFRNLYTVFKFVDRSAIENKKHYTSIVRAQLSSYELALFFYNCLWHIGRKKFKEIVEKYELLENMDLALIVNPKDQLPLYKRDAYGEIEMPDQYAVLLKP
jgi:uncharacterized membrane protein